MEIGIDIGTSYSSVALLDKDRVIPVKSDTGQCAYGNSYSIPSAVFAKNDGTLLIGQAAVASRMIAPSCFKDCFKREFGNDTAFLLGDNEFTTDQFYIEFFRHFKLVSEKLTGKPITKAYITHPANYSSYKKQKLKTAAAYAGLLDIYLIDEPTAAALSYLENNKIEPGKTLLVYDYGGGTFDLTLIKATKDGFELMTAPLGLEHCGGVDFDMLIYEDMINTLSEENDLSGALSNIKFKALLCEESIKTKHKLSFDDWASATVPYGYGDFLTYHITRDKYNTMIEGQVKETCDLIKEIVKNAGIEIKDIDYTLCVGGTTRTPFILEMVEKTLDKKVCQNADPDLAICCGAAAYSKNSIFLTPDKNKSENEKLEKDEVKQSTEALFTADTNVSKTDTSSAPASQSVNVSERRGNTIGNASNGAKFTFANGWVYYNNNFSLCKIHINGTGKALINNDSPHGIHIFDDWLFYGYHKGIMKYNINTAETVRLSYETTSFIIIIDNWIYYTNEVDHDALYKMQTDGTQKVKLVDDGTEFINIADGWIYYVNKSDGFRIYKMRMDGTGQTRISYDSSRFMNVIDNWIYYQNRDDASVYKILTDGSQRMRLNNAYSTDINVNNSWIYYIGSRKMLYRMRTDGTSLTCLKNVLPCFKFAICYDWIYYYDIVEVPRPYQTPEHRLIYHRMRTNGLEDQPI